MAKKDKEPIRLREKRLNDGSRSLYLDIYYDGSRSYEFLKLYLLPDTDKESREKNKRTMALANAVKAQRIISLQREKHGFGHNMMSDVSVVYYYGIVAEQRNPSLWASSKDVLEKYCGTKLKMKDIDKRFCEGYKSFLGTERARTKTGNGKHNLLSKSSQNAYFAKFKTFMRQAYNDGVIDEDYCRSIKSISHEQSKREYLTMDEIKLVAGASCKYDVTKRAFLFSCFTGLRLSDIRKLTWGEVYDNDGFTRIVFRQKKTGGMEYLDINEQAVAMMGERGRHNDVVFAGMKKGIALARDIERLTESAGISKHVTFHCARHTFATMMLTLGTDIYTTSKLLGHTDVKTTQIYAKIVDQKKREAVASIPRII